MTERTTNRRVMATFKESLVTAMVMVLMILVSSVGIWSIGHAIAFVWNIKFYPVEVSSLQMYLSVGLFIGATVAAIRDLSGKSKNKSRAGEFQRITFKLFVVALTLPAFFFVIKELISLYPERELLLSDSAITTWSLILFTVDITARGAFFDIFESFGLQIGSVMHNQDNLLISAIVLVHRTTISLFAIRGILGYLGHTYHYGDTLAKPPRGH